MRVADLATELNATTVIGGADPDVRDVTHDSRECSAGFAFVAISGEKVDGHGYIPQAVGRGAVAVISERDPQPSIDAAWLKVSDARLALAQAAAAVQGHPSRALKLVGITGTNGKTTTTHLVDSIIRAAEGKSAMIGTIIYRIADEIIVADRTTPEASTVQRLLKRAIEAGCRSAVMEVSSHSIELRRANVLTFETGVFTNLTRDHLDYHNTMENYFAAKKKLFDGSLGSVPVSVINIDDAYGRQLVECAKGRVLTYGFDAAAEIRTDEFELNAGGMSLSAATPAGMIEISSSLVGRPHVYNILAAIGAGLALGFDRAKIRAGIAACSSVPGRFEQVTVQEKPVDFTVVVDYAHTDDALRNVLQTARGIAGEKGRVITVFGCGGDRDRTKRAPMGEIAALLSDVVIVTSDNPRNEDPSAIIDDIEAGLRKSGRRYINLPDRREAIFQAVATARGGDIVVIAGKGHETYQTVGATRLHFDDREVAREAMLAL